jgi:NADPH-dependent ferric siderophore reductase
MATSEVSSGAVPGQRRRPRPYPAVVTSISPVSPYLLSIGFGGDDLGEFRWPGPASHLKLFLPEPGQRQVELPPADSEGRMLTGAAWPHLTTRTFTPRRFDPVTGRLDLEVVLHGHGPASQWAGSARAGDRVAVSQPRRTYEVMPDTRWALLAGDETAIPAIATLLEAIGPGLRVDVIIELEPSHDPVALPAHPGVHPVWISRRPEMAASEALVTAVSEWSLPPGPGQAWVACEAARVRAIRRHLLEVVGLPVDRALTRGYWREGEANHPDHDYGEDAL